MIKNKNLARLSLFGTLALSVLALVNKEITIFYMLYLFWWNALIDLFAKIFTDIKKGGSVWATFRKSSSALYILAMYWIFIVILFGIVFSFYDFDLFVLNAQVLSFQNTPFVLNIILMILIAVLTFNSNQESTDTEIGFFSARMLILHVSIILGAFVHFGMRHFLGDTEKTSIYPYLLSAVPFLLIRTYFDWKMSEDE